MTLIDPDERVLLARERTALANERNRLANERTYLAWIRTGLASVGGGLAVMRFLIFNNPTHQLAAQIAGSILVILGILIFFLSFFDFRKSYQKLQLKEGFTGGVGTISLISFVLILVSFVLLLIAFRS